jgi:hypothetical protein
MANIEKGNLENKIVSLEGKIRSCQFDDYNAKSIRRNLQKFKKAINSLEEQDKPQCLQLILRDVEVYRNRMVLNNFDLPEFAAGS